jgi:hypothetical protein
MVVVTGVPWLPPSDHVFVSRRWKYAPPPWVVYEAIVNDNQRWLTLLRGETAPKVAVSRRPDAVLLRPWVDPAVIAVELRIEQDGANGSAISVLAYGGGPQLSEETRQRVRYRLGVIFGADLRAWLDEPHS